MRKREIVKIDDKEFAVKELTIQEIMDLMQQTALFGGGELKDNGVEGKKKDDLSLLMGDVGNLVNISCDFKMDDLKKLAPSEIKLIYEAWNRVNADFLFTLKALGLSDILVNIKDAVLSNFSNLLAISLKADM